MQIGNIVKISYGLSILFSIIGAYLKITHIQEAETFLFIAIISTLVFIISAIYEVRTSPNIAFSEKNMWTIVLIFFSGIAGLIYIFMGRKRITKNFKTNSMKQAFILLMLFMATTFLAHSQTEHQPTLLYDGMYIGKTGSVAAANIEIYTYLRFYKDGTVYQQAVSSYDPAAVSKWFGRDKTFSQKGRYKIDGTNIIIQMDNKNTEDIKLEGYIKTDYKGFIKTNNQIFLVRDKEEEERGFTFFKEE